jgi:hypothetical protein
MNKVHRPHRESGYIAKVDFQQSTDGSGKPDWVMLYMPGPKARAEFRAFAKRGGPPVVEIEPLEAPPLLEPQPSQLEQELIQRGVTPVAAADLARDHAEEKIMAQIERLDWLIEKKPEKIADPAAYLVGAIRSDYAPPKGFVSKPERERREEALKAKERQAAQERRRQQQEDARQKEEQAAIVAYWESLTPEQQSELDEAAKAQADAETLALETGPFKRFGKQIRRDNYIRQLLKNQKPVLVEA